MRNSHFFAIHFKVYYKVTKKELIVFQMPLWPQPKMQDPVVEVLSMIPGIEGNIVVVVLTTYFSVLSWWGLTQKKNAHTV